MLFLTGCQRDYSGALACDGPIAAPAPSALYRDKSIGDLETLASAGDLVAARVLGERYEQGDGVASDMKEAVRWYRQAAFIPPTTTFVAAPAVGGRTGFVVPVTAGLARPGDSVAMADLGRLYEVGKGVGRDTVRAEALSSCADRSEWKTENLSFDWIDPAKVKHTVVFMRGTNMKHNRMTNKTLRILARLEFFSVVLTYLR
jgi:hypothetical protein